MLFCLALLSVREAAHRLSNRAKVGNVNLVEQNFHFAKLVVSFSERLQKLGDEGAKVVYYRCRKFDQFEAELTKYF